MVTRALRHRDAVSGRCEFGYDGSMKDAQDILAYIRQRTEPFSRLSYCDADALVLSALSYYHFEDVPEIAEMRASVRVCDLLSYAPLETYAQRMFGDKNMGTLLEAIIESPRFGPLSLLHFSYYVSEELTTQFSATTFRISEDGVADEELVLSFRGTDIEQLAWNEDFNLCIMPEIPSELFAVTYFESVLQVHPGARVHLTGHSKGGTLAEFACATADDEQAGKIADVVTFDAPGLSCLGSHACPEFIERDSDMALLQHERGVLLKKYVFPSMLGLLMETRPVDRLLTVDTSGAGMGHDVFTPKIVDGIIQTKAYPGWMLDNGLWVNRWVVRLSLDERRAVIDCLFDAFGPDANSFVFRGPQDMLSVLLSAVRGRVHLPRAQGRLVNRAALKLRQALF